MFFFFTSNITLTNGQITLTTQVAQLEYNKRPNCHAVIQEQTSDLLLLSHCSVYHKNSNKQTNYRSASTVKRLANVQAIVSIGAKKTVHCEHKGKVQNNCCQTTVDTGVARLP